jgi:hypothetical protein
VYILFLIYFWNFHPPRPGKRVASPLDWMCQSVHSLKHHCWKERERDWVLSVLQVVSLHFRMTWLLDHDFPLLHTLNRKDREFCHISDCQYRWDIGSFVMQIWDGLVLLSENRLFSLRGCCCLSLVTKSLLKVKRGKAVPLTDCGGS